jgi:hypothetical protein
VADRDSHKGDLIKASRGLLGRISAMVGLVGLVGRFWGAA